MTANNKLAIVFPGQGSQSIGMLQELATTETIVEEIFARASTVLAYDLWQIVAEGPETKLNSTEITQPALLAASYAVWKIWQQKSQQSPALLAGHSLGEYTALVCADVIPFETAIRLVAERGRCMQAAVPAGVGAMAAVLGLDDETVNKVCEQLSAKEMVAAANYNSPGQIVIAGHQQAVEQAVSACKEAGAKRALILPVSVPSHCLLMRAAADEFSRTLNEIDFSDATIPVIQNVDAQARISADAIRPALLEQLYKPVQWVNSIETMRTKNINRIIECGPGKVLAGLIKRIDRGIETQCIQDQASLDKALA